MKHTRGIELAAYDSLAELADWHVLVGQCSRCRHVGRVYWTNVRRRFAGSTSIDDLPQKFRCRECGNRQGNRISIETMARD